MVHTIAGKYSVVATGVIEFASCLDRGQDYSNSWKYSGLYDTGGANVIRTNDDLFDLFLVTALHQLELANHSIQYIAGDKLVLAKILGTAICCGYLALVCRNDSCSTHIGRLAAYIARHHFCDSLG